MRTFAAIYLSVDADKDFQRLHFREQHMYWTLLRQRKLNRAGLLDLNIYKWAKSAGGMTEESVVQSLAILAERKYVVIDVHTRELLIRTYVRGDGAYKMPRVMASVVSAAHEIESPRLRRALLAEIDRIPLDELSDEPGKNDAPSIRARVLGYVMQLRKVLEDGSPDDPDGLSTPCDTPTVAQLRGIAGVSDTQNDSPADTRVDTQSQGPGTRVGARVVPSPSPVPSPVPEPNPLVAAALFDVEEPAGSVPGAGKPRKGAKPKAAAKSKPPADPEIAARNRVAVELAQEWYDAQDPKPASAFVGYQQIFSRLLAAGHSPDMLAAAAKASGFAMTLNSMEYQLKRLSEVVIPFQRPGAHAPYRNDPDKDRSAGFPGATIYEGA